MFCLAVCFIFAYLNYQDQTAALSRQAYSPQFLLMTNIQDAMNTTFLLLVFCLVWIIYLLASLFGSCYVLGVQHGRGKPAK